MAGVEPSYKHLIASIPETEALYENILQTRRLLTDLTFQDRRWAPILQQAIATFEAYAAEMNAAAVTAAAFAQRAITTLLRQRIVRPPTGKTPGLTDVIHCDVTNQGGVSFATVEVAWVSELNKAINPFARTQRGQAPYWWSQEFGNTKNLGRQIQGLFVGDGQPASGPDPTQFRVHPMFAASNKVGVGGAGTINRAIDPKWFLRDGTDATIDMWRGLVATANANCVRRVNELLLRIDGMRAALA